MMCTTLNLLLFKRESKVFLDVWRIEKRDEVKETQFFFLSGDIDGEGDTFDTSTHCDSFYWNLRRFIHTFVKIII